MKKLFFYALLLTVGLLQSCSVNTETMYFKDATFTTQLDLDAGEMLGMMKDFAAQDSSDIGSMSELENLPKDWTSFYDLQLADGKEIPKDKDSIRLMKKSFLKSNYNNDEVSGFSIKMEKFTQKEYEGFSFLNSDNIGEMGFAKQAFTQWDGKTLTIDTSDFNSNFLSKKLSEEDGSESAELESMMQMLDMKMQSTLKFENKIKSIEGKHDWVKQLDDYTVVINFDLRRSADDKASPLKNDDKKIIIKTQ